MDRAAHTAGLDLLGCAGWEWGSGFSRGLLLVSSHILPSGLVFTWLPPQHTAQGGGGSMRSVSLDSDPMGTEPPLPCFGPEARAPTATLGIRASAQN